MQIALVVSGRRAPRAAAAVAAALRVPLGRPLRRAPRWLLTGGLALVAALLRREGTTPPRPPAWAQVVDCVMR